SVQIAATAEAMALASKVGLDLETVAKALQKGAASSPNVIRSSTQIVESRHDENVHFNASLRLKDSLYGLSLAEEFDQVVPLGATATDAFQKTVDAGYGGNSESSVIEVYAKKCK
ncbi:hypothetical protein AC249_AIPGENE7056, partial [Exaiptasia diaphana]